MNNFFLFEISSLSPSVEHELKCVSDSGATWCQNPGEMPGEAEGDRTDLDADCCR